MLFTSSDRSGWTPFAEMRRMQSEFNRLFADLDRQPAAAFPPVGIWVSDQSLVITAELPGVAEKDLDLSVQRDTLTIQGKREPGPDGDRVAWHRRERAHGAFSRVVELPLSVDPDGVQARLHNGILEVELQRPEADRPKRIQIETH